MTDPLGPNPSVFKLPSEICTRETMSFVETKKVTLLKQMNVNKEKK